MDIVTNNPAFRLVLPDCETVELVEPFEVDYGFYKRIIPPRFITDFESVPKCCQWIFSKLGKGALPGVAHDDLYATGAMSRAMADAAYLALCKHFKMFCLSRWTKYLVLRAVGWIAWNAHRRRERMKGVIL